MALAAPEAEASPDADAFYGQYTWPGYGGLTPYGPVSSTCWGCRPYHFYYGKRSAEPHGVIAPGIAGHPGPATSYVGRTIFGYPHLHYGKRSAEPHGAGVAVHPGHAVSHVGPTTFGYPSIHPFYGKREAEAEAQPEAAPEAEASPDADAFYGHYGYGLPLAYGGYGYGFPGGYTHVPGLYAYHHPYAYWG